MGEDRAARLSLADDGAVHLQVLQTAHDHRSASFQVDPWPVHRRREPHEHGRFAVAPTCLAAKDPIQHLFGAAADRWFVKRDDRKEWIFKPWYQSLALGSFPIQRGGGSKTLEHSHWLLENGANLLIFPEGTRSTSRSMARFKHGVSILALEHDVPVVPCYLTGMNNVRPKGKSGMVEAPVSASFLPPIRFEPGTSVPDATHLIYERLNTVHKAVQERGIQAAVEASEATG